MSPKKQQSDRQSRILKELVEMRRRLETLERPGALGAGGKDAAPSIGEKAVRYLDSAGVLIIAIDKNQQATFINKKACDALGYRKEEILGKNCFDLLLPEKVKTGIKEVFKKTIAGKSEIIEYFEFPVITKEEREKLIGWYNTKITDSAGKVVGMLSAGIDITERKRADEERERFFAISMDMLCVLGFDGYIKQLNPAWEKTLGTPNEELKSRPFIDFIHPEDRRRTLIELQRLTTGAKDASFENRCRGRDGTYRWFLWHAVPFAEESEIYAAALDITDRKRTEQLLLDSEARFRLLFENSPVGISISRGGIVLYVNRACVSIFGYDDASEILGKNIAENIQVQHHATDIPEKLRQDRRDKGALLVYETVGRKQDGTGIQVYVRATVMELPDGLANVAFLTDISDRKKAEDALKAERDRAQKYLDIAGAILVAIDADQKVSMVNKKGCEVLGYAQNEIVGKNWFDNFVPECVREPVKNAFGELMAGNEKPVEYFENSVLTRSGEERIVAWHNAVLRNDRGEIRGTLSSGEDITERKNSQEALRESEEMFKRLAETTSAGIFIYRGKRLIYVNSTCEQITGYNKQELLSIDFIELFHPDFKNALISRIAARRRGEDIPPRFEYKMVRKDGKEIWAELFTTPTNFKGNPAVIGTCYDVTERKNAEDAVHRSEGKFKRLAEATPAAVYISVGSRIIYANPACEKMTGYSAGELQSVDFLELAHPDSRQLIIDRNKARASGKEVPKSFEFKIIRKDGEVRLVETYSAPIEFEGKPAAIGTSFDITDRKNAESAKKKP